MLNPPQVSTLNILVADDSELTQRLLRLVFSRMGHITDTATNGMDVLEALTTHHYDVILLDIHMPLLDGVETAMQIRNSEQGKSVVLIAISGDSDKENHRAYLDAGFNYFLEKPIELRQIQNLITEIADC